MNNREQAEAVASGLTTVNDNDTKHIVRAILSLKEDAVQPAQERKKLEVRTWFLRGSLAFNVGIVSALVFKILT